MAVAHIADGTIAFCCFICSSRMVSCRASVIRLYVCKELRGPIDMNLAVTAREPYAAVKIQTEAPIAPGSPYHETVTIPAFGILFSTNLGLQPGGRFRGRQLIYKRPHVGMVCGRLRRCATGSPGHDLMF